MGARLTAALLAGRVATGSEPTARPRRRHRHRRPRCPAHRADRPAHRHQAAAARLGARLWHQRQDHHHAADLAHPAAGGDPAAPQPRRRQPAHRPGHRRRRADAAWRAGRDADIGLFEVDEATLPRALQEVGRAVCSQHLSRSARPLRRGPLRGRFGATALGALPADTALVLNADDPLVAGARAQRARRAALLRGRRSSVGAADVPHAADARLCPAAAPPSTYSVCFYGHLGLLRLPAAAACARPTPDVRRPASPCAATGQRRHDRRRRSGSSGRTLQPAGSLQRLQRAGRHGRLPRRWACDRDIIAPGLETLHRGLRAPGAHPGRGARSSSWRWSRTRSASPRCCARSCADDRRAHPADRHQRPLRRRHRRLLALGRRLRAARGPRRTWPSAPARAPRTWRCGSSTRVVPAGRIVVESDPRRALEQALARGEPRRDASTSCRPTPRCSRVRDCCGRTGYVARTSGRTERHPPAPDAGTPLPRPDERLRRPRQRHHASCGARLARHRARRAAGQRSATVSTPASVRPDLLRRRPGPRAGGGLARPRRPRRARPCARPSRTARSLLSVCGGYQLLGHTYTTVDGQELPGRRAVRRAHGARHAPPHRQRRRRDRPGRHAARRWSASRTTSGQTYLGPGCTPLGRVAQGGGNNGEDGTEGAVYQDAYRLLPARLAAAEEPLARRPSDRAARCGAATATRAPLAPLDDRLEERAHAAVVGAGPRSWAASAAAPGRAPPDVRPGAEAARARPRWSVMAGFVLSRVLGLVRNVVIGAAVRRPAATTRPSSRRIAIPDLVFQVLAGGAVGVGLHPGLQGLLRRGTTTRAPGG